MIETLFPAIMDGNGNAIKTIVVQRYFNQVQNNFKNGTWSKDSDNTEGIYDKHLELLEIIEFPFE